MTSKTPKPSKGAVLFSEFVKKKKLNFSEVARQLSDGGYKVTRMTTWNWSNARVVPSRKSALAINRLTDGKIPPESWDLPPKR